MIHRSLTLSSHSLSSLSGLFVPYITPNPIDFISLLLFVLSEEDVITLKMLCFYLFNVSTTTPAACGPKSVQRIAVPPAHRIVCGPSDYNGTNVRSATVVSYDWHKTYDWKRLDTTTTD